MPRHIESRRAKKVTGASHHEPSGHSATPRAAAGEHPLAALQRSIGNSSTLAYLDRGAASAGGVDAAHALVARSLAGAGTTLQRRTDEELETELEESEQDDVEGSEPTTPSAASHSSPVSSPSGPAPTAGTTPSEQTPQTPSGPSTPSSEPSGPAHEASGPASDPSPTSSPVAGLAPVDEMETGTSAVGPSPTSSVGAAGTESGETEALVEQPDEQNLGETRTPRKGGVRKKGQKKVHKKGTTMKAYIRAKKLAKKKRRLGHKS